jgi:DNA repair protein SbcC/Rad50
MFSRFFKPRWQHTDPSIRARAAAELDPANEADAVALGTLARGDASASVRLAAASRLRDTRLLEQLIQRDTDARVRDGACQQLARLLCGQTPPAPSLENRLRMVALSNHLPLLVEVARHGDDTALRLAAINKLDDQALLLQLALEGVDAESRMAAANKVQQPELLRQLVREGRDKKVLQLARERLKHHQQVQQQQSRHQQRADELIEQFRAHAGRPYDNLYPARLQQMRQSWHEVEAEARDDQQQAVAKESSRCDAVIHAWQQQQATELAARESARQSVLEFDAAVTTLAESLQALTDSDDWQPANSLSALLASQQRRWLAAAEHAEPDSALARRFKNLEQQWQQLITLWADFSPAQRDWPATLPHPPALRQPLPEEDSTSSTADEPRPDRHELDRTLGVLQGALRQRQLKFANRLWHRIEPQLADAGPAQRQRAEKLKPQLDELRDWHAFAAEPKKQQLCERMEQLVEQPLPPQEKADAIQLLHDEWKALMSADQQSDQALWERFRAASDAAWVPCREHFAELDRQRADNLARRVALCQQLDQYLNALTQNQNPDWPAVAEIRRQAPQEWKGYQPVRYTDVRDLGKRFSAQLKQLDELLDQAAAEGRARLEALIASAETLAASDDSRQAADQFKQLQKQWQQAGWVPQTVQRKLYKKFRQLADAVFARREQEQSAHRQQLTEEAAALRTALASLEQALRDARDDEAMAALASQIEQVANLPCPRREEKLLQQRDALVREARQRRQRWPQWQRWAALREQIAGAPTTSDSPAQQQLAVALEVTAGLPSPEHAKEQRMQWQLAQLTQAMKSSNGLPTDRCRELLEHSGLMQQGLADDARQRILTVWQSLEPNA